jgi:hypothetical protein
MSLRLSGQGTLHMALKNIHKANNADNVVTLTLQGEELFKLGKDEQAEISVEFTDGDVLVIGEEYAVIYIISLAFEQSCDGTTTATVPDTTRASTTTATGTTIAATSTTPTTTTTTTTTSTTATSTSTSTATDCTVGQFLNGGTNECKPCPAGTFMNKQTHGDELCEQWTECLSNQYEVVGGTAQRNTVCSSTTVCDSLVQYETRPAGSDGDRQCTGLTDCVAGEFVQLPATPTSDRTCGRCDGAEVWQSEADQPQCLPMASCTVDERVVVVGTRKQNVQCGPCPAGTEQPAVKHRHTTCVRVSTTRTSSTNTRTTTTRTITTRTNPTTTAVVDVAGGSVDPNGSKAGSSAKRGGTPKHLAAIVIGGGLLAIVIIIAAVVVVRKTTGEHTARPGKDTSVLSYENPLYAKEFELQRAGRLEIPEHSGVSGYMDVPSATAAAAGGGQGTGGYMDVHVASATGAGAGGTAATAGYMSVQAAPAGGAVGYMQVGASAAAGAAGASAGYMMVEPDLGGGEYTDEEEEV